MVSLRPQDLPQLRDELARFGGQLVLRTRFQNEVHVQVEP